MAVRVGNVLVNIPNLYQRILAIESGPRREVRMDGRMTRAGAAADQESARIFRRSRNYNYQALLQALFLRGRVEVISNEINSILARARRDRRSFRGGVLSLAVQRRLEPLYNELGMLARSDAFQLGGSNRAINREDVIIQNEFAVRSGLPMVPFFDLLSINRTLNVGPLNDIRTLEEFDDLSRARGLFNVADRIDRFQGDDVLGVPARETERSFEDLRLRELQLIDRQIGIRPTRNLERRRRRLIRDLPPEAVEEMENNDLMRDQERLVDQFNFDLRPDGTFANHNVSQAELDRRRLENETTIGRNLTYQDLVDAKTDLFNTRMRQNINGVRNTEDTIRIINDFLTRNNDVTLILISTDASAITLTSDRLIDVGIANGRVYNMTSDIAIISAFGLTRLFRLVMTIRRNIAGAYVPYLLREEVPLDISKYGLFKRSQTQGDCHNYETLKDLHCLVQAVLGSGDFKSPDRFKAEVVNYLKFALGKRLYNAKDLTSICKKFNIQLRVYKYYDSCSEFRPTTYNDKAVTDNVIRVTLHEQHFLTYENINKTLELDLFTADLNAQVEACPPDDRKKLILELETKHKKIYGMKFKRKKFNTSARAFKFLMDYKHIFLEPMRIEDRTSKDLYNKTVSRLDVLGYDSITVRPITVEWKDEYFTRVQKKKHKKTESAKITVAVPVFRYGSYDLNIKNLENKYDLGFGDTDDEIFDNIKEKYGQVPLDVLLFMQRTGLDLSDGKVWFSSNIELKIKVDRGVIRFKMSNDDNVYSHHLFKEREEKQRLIFVADTETVTDDNGKMHVVKMCIMHKGWILFNKMKDPRESYKQYNLRWFKAVTNYGGEDRVLQMYFHNSKFDCSVIDTDLPDNVYPEKEIRTFAQPLRTYKFYSNHEKEVEIRVLDTYAFFNTSLENFAAGQGVALHKDAICFSYVTERNYQRSDTCSLDEFMAVESDELQTKLKNLWLSITGRRDKNMIEMTEHKMKQLKKKHRELKAAMLENIKEWGLGDEHSFNWHEYISRYCDKDVKILDESIKKFARTLLEVYGLDFYDFYTAANLSMGICMRQGVCDGVFRFTDELKAFISTNVVGGRVNMWRGVPQYFNFEDITSDDLLVVMDDFDANSCYPSAMVDIDVPLGVPKVVMGEPPADCTFYFALVEVVKVGNYRGISCLHSRNDEGNLIWAFNDGDILGKRIVYNKIQVENAIKYCQVEFKFYYTVYFPAENGTARNFDMINSLYHRRLQVKRTSEGALLKLIMNSAYGKMIERKHETFTSFFHGSEEKLFEEKFEKGTGEICQYDALPGGFKIKVNKKREDHFNYCHVGAMILSQSKNNMNEVIYMVDTIHDNLEKDFSHYNEYIKRKEIVIPDLFNPEGFTQYAIQKALPAIKVWYTDTDSMHIPSFIIPIIDWEFRCGGKISNFGARWGRESNSVIGKGLGQFESDFKLIRKYKDHEGREVKNPRVYAKRSYFVSPKCYLDELEAVSGNDILGHEIHSRMKGIPSETHTLTPDGDGVLNEIEIFDSLYKGKGMKFWWYFTNTLKMDVKHFSVTKNNNFSRTVQPVTTSEQIIEDPSEMDVDI